jgi:hypothetical protein
LVRNGIASKIFCGCTDLQKKPEIPVPGHPK